MNDLNETRHKRKIPAKLTAGGGLVGILVVIYALLQPLVSKQFGIDLPKLPINSGSDTIVVAQADNIDSSPTSPKVSAPKSSVVPRIQVTEDAAPATPKTKPEASADKPSQSTKSAPDKKVQSKPDPNLRYGILQPIGRDNFMSPAGLRYTPGSEEGHRLKHLERHTADQPSRPGKHGVFEGGMEKTLAVLDQAYEKATKGGHGTTKTEDDGRTIYTVDMGKRIGYIGGRDGNRMRKPMARRVRIVLDGNRVITAYPL